MLNRQQGAFRVPSSVWSVNRVWSLPASADGELKQTAMETTRRKQWMQGAVEAARIGGQILLDWTGQFSVREKSRANLVTDADLASQAAILQHLKGLFPDHGFLGEENLNLRTAGTSESETFWIIDPLDGTSNYVHGFPYFAVSIGLYSHGDLQAAAIFDPTRNDMFAAARGLGATLNGKPISTSQQEDIERAMGVASLPITPSPDHPAIRRFLKALGQMQTVQRTGSAALNLAYLAAGRLDAFWSTNLSPWDIAAGVLIVQEAGGIVTNLKGEQIDIFVPDLLATASQTLHQQVCSELA